MFALRHYLVIEADSFPRVSLSGNCLHLWTDNVRGQISVHIFAPNRGYFSTYSPSDIPQFQKLTSNTIILRLKSNSI